MKKGFTLIELLVSVAIFTVVMVISLGALLSMSEADRKAETLKSVMNNLNFALDSMSRAIRTGSSYNCGSTDSGNVPTPRDCQSGASSIVFLAAAGSQAGCTAGNDCIVMYCRGFPATNSCDSTGSDPTATTILRSINGSSLTPVTSPEVIISNLDFYAVGTPRNDSLQPKVTILLNGFVQVTGKAATQSQCNTPGLTCSSFNLQTSVTQRIYDL